MQAFISALDVLPSAAAHWLPPNTGGLISISACQLFHFMRASSVKLCLLGI